MLMRPPSPFTDSLPAWKAFNPRLTGSGSSIVNRPPAKGEPACWSCCCSRNALRLALACCTAASHVLGGCGCPASPDMLNEALVEPMRLLGPPAPRPELSADSPAEALLWPGSRSCCTCMVVMYSLLVLLLQ
jgi:hypothetical protein